MRWTFFILLASPAIPAWAGQPARLQADLLIVGGTESGCAAAIQAARMGVPAIVLVNEIDWLGGQFSSAGLVAIDENADGTGVKIGLRHKPPIPRSGLFKEAIERIEDVNQRKYGRRHPGNTIVLTTCRPADAAQVFRDLLQPYVASGQVRIISDHVVASARLNDDGRTLGEVRFQSAGDPASQIIVAASMTIDASDWGEVIKASGAAYEFGPDLKSTYNEPFAPTSRSEYPITDMNPLTYTMVIVEKEQATPIPRPLRYDSRCYDKLPYPMTHEFCYTSRRVVDHYNFKDVKGPDVVLLCHPAQDYPLDILPAHVAEALEKDEAGASKKNIVQLSRRQRQIIFDDARQHSLGFLYWLQTTLHDKLPDKSHSFRRFELTDEFGTDDGMPWTPYVRESLRMRSMYMCRQQDTLGVDGNAKDFAQVMYHDGVFAWQFEYDFHPTRRHFLVAGDASAPWHALFRKGRTWGPPYSGFALFPMRSLIPERVDGLLGAERNLGFTSLVSAAVRLHDHSMAVGQAAGATAAVALKHKCPPRDIPFDLRLLTEVHRALASRIGGGEPATLWPFRDLDSTHHAFEAINLLAIRGALPIAPTETKFLPDSPATDFWRKQVVARSLTRIETKTAPDQPSGDLTRADFARRWWDAIKHLPVKPAIRRLPNDADADGVLDTSDATPLGWSWNER